MNWKAIFFQLRHTPVTAWLIFMSGIGAILTSNDWGLTYIHFLSFQDFTDTHYIPLSDSLSRGEIWRFFTPVFLHFGLFHFLFNSLWMWDLGRRLELLLGRWHFLFFIVITGIISNYAQYYWSNESLFGGMSGVVYALVGFIAGNHGFSFIMHAHFNSNFTVAGYNNRTTTECMWIHRYYDDDIQSGM